MARTKAMLGAGAWLADYLSASLLARVLPAEVVNEVLDAHGRNSQRLRSFPAVAGVYYCIALSLYPEAAYEEVFAAVAQGLAWAAGAAEPIRVSKVSISLARSKIGAAPLQDLVRRCCVPMADELALTVFDTAHSDFEECWFTLGNASDGRLLAVLHT